MQSNRKVFNYINIVNVRGNMYKNATFRYRQNLTYSNKSMKGGKI